MNLSFSPIDTSCTLLSLPFNAIAPLGRHSMYQIITLLNPFIGIRIIYNNHDLLKQMLIRNITSRYHGSVLGFIWSFVHPLTMLTVYTFVFGIIFKARWGIESFKDNNAAFPLIMFCGMSVFNIFSESINSSTTIIVNNQSYVKKVVFPLELLPLCNVLTSFIFGIAWFSLLFAGTLIFLRQISWTMLLLPLPLLTLLLFSTGLSFLVASLGVYLRDIQQLVGIITQILFFMTPIFYPTTMVPESLRWIIYINPLSTIVEQIRQLFLYGQFPDIIISITLLIISLIIFQLGLAWFIKTKKGFADVL